VREREREKYTNTNRNIEEEFKECKLAGSLKKR
jgi:hypothetical protein